MTYENIIIACWAAFLIVWMLSAFSVKRDIKGGGFSSWWSRFFLLRVAIGMGVVLIALRVATRSAHYANWSPSSHALFTPPVFLGWVGALLTVLGICFAVWARVHLGRNWSASPAVKEHHELVTSGPYRFVRHPIYTGILLAGLGTMLTGSVFAIGVCIIGPVVFLLRIKKEERIMSELFPNEYPAYQAGTKRLIPWVW